MPYNFWVPPVPEPKYVDVTNFFRGMKAGQDEQESKSRNALLQAEVGMVPTKNALLQENLAGAQSENEAKRMSLFLAKKAEFAKNLSEDDPGTLREQISEGLKNKFFVKPPTVNGKQIDQWTPEDQKRFVRKTKMEGLSLEKQMEMQQPGYGLTGDAANMAQMTGKKGEELLPYFLALKKREQASSDLTKLIQERDSLPEGDPNRKLYDDRIRNMTAGMPTFAGVSTGEGVSVINTKTGEVVPTGQKKQMTSEMVTAEQQIGTLKDTLNRVKSTYNDDYVGPVGGRYGQAKGEWVGLPQDQSEFYADVAQINNTLVYLMSGKQINEQEYERLKKQLPSANLPTSTFKARMSTFEKTVDSIIENRKKNMGAYVKDGEKKETKPVQAAPETSDLPETQRLNESEILSEMKKHKATREQVIKAYRQLIGAE